MAGDEADRKVWHERLLMRRLFVSMPGEAVAAQRLTRSLDYCGHQVSSTTILFQIGGISVFFTNVLCVSSVDGGVYEMRSQLLELSFGLRRRNKSGSRWSWRSPDDGRGCTISQSGNVLHRLKHDDR